MSTVEPKSTMPRMSWRKTAVPKLRFLSSFRSTMGSGWFHSHQAKKTSSGDGEDREGANHGIAEPVLLLALVEGELEAADAEGDEAEAHEVDFEMPGLLAPAFEMRRIFDHAVAEIEREDADGKIDEEDPVPVEVVGDPAAEGGTDGGRDDDGHAVDGEGLAAFFDGEGVGQDGLLAGRETAAAGALQDAGDDQQRQSVARGRRATSRW